MPSRKRCASSQGRQHFRVNFQRRNDVTLLLEQIQKREEIIETAEIAMESFLIFLGIFLHTSRTVLSDWVRQTRLNVCELLNNLISGVTPSREEAIATQQQIKYFLSAFSKHISQKVYLTTSQMAVTLNTPRPEGQVGRLDGATLIAMLSYVVASSDTPLIFSCSENDALKRIVLRNDFYEEDYILFCRSIQKAYRMQEIMNWWRVTSIRITLCLLQFQWSTVPIPPNLRR